MKFPIVVVLSLAAVAHCESTGGLLSGLQAKATDLTDRVGKWVAEQKTAKNNKDVEHWKSVGAANANKDLDKFEAALEHLANGQKGAVVTAINDLKAQIVDADSNNQDVAPKITKVAGLIYTLSRQGGTLSSADRMAICGVVRILDDVRDNKSYYVLDGAQNWVQLRIDILAKIAASSPAVAKLAADLKALQDTIIALRDQLDSIAGRFVKGIKALVELSKNDANVKDSEIQEIAKNMKDATSEGPSFLTNSVAVVANADALVKSV